jgi:PPOX class probable F420-dependent enzyme
MDVDECRRRFAAAEHGYLATAGDDGRPHVVPVVFAVDADRIVTAVDSKPKRTTRLRRLRNVGQNPQVAFLVDVYESDWDRLWWVRADANAEVVEAAAAVSAVALLQAKYPQYDTTPPNGPVLLADVYRWSGWSASR